jgi:poly(3-hydroxybutyrate) depolymerase
MTRPRSVSHFLHPVIAMLLVAGCAPVSSGGGGTGGDNGTGGFAQTGGTTGTGGTPTGTGGNSTGTGGNVTGTGGNLTGSGGHTGGSTGSGGNGGTTVSVTGGAGGHVSGSGGVAGDGGGMAGHHATGGAAGGTSGTGTGGSGGASVTPGMSAGCGKAPGIASSMYNNGTRIPFTSGSQQRRYILNVPTNYDNSHAYKLIITYHELNGNDVEMYNQKFYNLLPQSNNTAIFIAPNGTQSSGSPCTGTGSGDSGCGWPNSGNADLTYVDALVKTIEDNFCVDTSRIFATGWSYGGSMSYKTACERPLSGTGYIRAIAVYSGSQLSGNCTPSKPVAYYASHGTHDSVLNYSNGVGLAQNFAKANGCNWATPTSVSSGAHVCTNEMGCMTGYPVEFCSFNGDHTPFPDNGQESSSWEAANAWMFLNQF